MFGSEGARGEEGRELPAFNLALVIGVGIATAVLACNVYLVWKTVKVDGDVNRLRASTDAALASLRSEVSAANSAGRRAIEAMQVELGRYADETRGSAQRATQQASNAARKHAEQIAGRLAEQQRKNTQALSASIREVREAATATGSKVETIVQDVGAVRGEVKETRNEVAETKSGLAKIVAELRTARGDLGIQSGLIATNTKEITALRAMGEREYHEFTLEKRAGQQRIGPIAVELKKADPKKFRYSVDVRAGERKIEKKNRTINEPLQLYAGKTRNLIEIVVNDVPDKNRIVGYVSVPKREAGGR